MDNMKDNHFKVRIQCMTYNHAPYIEDAMNGFCMQQTDFPFLAVVVDDASTDGEPEVIKHYLAEHFDNEALDLPTPDETDEYVRVFARHKENKNCYFLVMFLKYNHYSIKKAKLTSVADLLRPIPYIALCEGDDYWIDPQKLQRQVDFLDRHEEYTASTENGRIHFLPDNTFALFSEEKTRDVSFDDLLIQRRFPTASVVYRSCHASGLSRLTPPRFDTLTWAYLATQGRIHFNSFVSSVYRRGCGITSSDKIRWAYTVRSFNVSLYNNFEVSDKIKAVRNEDVYDSLINGIKEAKRQNRFVDVIKLSFYGMQIHPKRMIRFLIK